MKGWHVRVSATYVHGRPMGHIKEPYSSAVPSISRDLIVPVC